MKIALFQNDALVPFKTLDVDGIDMDNAGVIRYDDKTFRLRYIDYANDVYNFRESAVLYYDSFGFIRKE